MGARKFQPSQCVYPVTTMSHTISISTQPLLFTILVELDVSQTIGVVSITIFFIIAIVVLSFAAPWDEIVAESRQTIDTPNQEEPAA